MYNQELNRFRIAVIGESGSGLLSTGEILTKALKRLGFYLVADREYPSLIKGGYSYYALNVSTQPIKSLSKEVDVLLALDKQSMEQLTGKLRDGGLLVHGYEKLKGIADIRDELAKRGVTEVHVQGREIAFAQGGNTLMTNVVLLGVLWKTLGLPYAVLAEEITEKFKNKPKLLEIDLRCAEAGYADVETLEVLQTPNNQQTEDLIVLNGNRAIALGAIEAGCRAYYAYPMSPSSSILTYMADYEMETDIVVKQVEDEISVAQMAIGSMYAGTRALAATSGGGFDLMTESVSLCGIIENPFVIVIAQRPGPGTGLPTWTAQGDLKIAIHSGHGEFARLVVAVSDAEDSFYLIQHAFNYAEEFQIPVIVLTEKVISESLWSIDQYEQYSVPIKRGLVVDETELANVEGVDRYKITESGISRRWLPGASDTYYFANGDEHLEDGSLTEAAEPSRDMYAKRVRKLETLRESLPEPEVIGPKDAELSFVGWGSTKGTMEDVIALAQEQGKKINYLHFSYVYPLKTEKLIQFAAAAKKLVLIEGNYTGQLGEVIQAETQIQFADKFLKYDGRPFFVEEVLEYINNS